MPQLTPDLLEKIKKDYWYIFNEYQRKDALLLAQELEKEIHTLEISNPGLFAQYQSFIGQLKWVAFPLMQKDFDMMTLAQNYFLDGLKNEELDLRKIVTDKGELLFEIGSREFLGQFLSALRNNQQEIGTEPIIIKEESNLVRPSIKNWLIDYLRNTTAQNPTEIDESNYLFNNPNAKKLKENDKKILSKLLSFYDIFKYVAEQIAMDEMRAMVPQTPVSLGAPQPSYAQGYGGQATTAHLPQKKFVPAAPPASAPITAKPMHAPRPTQPVPQSPYLEPVEEQTPPFSKGRLGGISTPPAEQINPGPPLQKEGAKDDFDQLRQAPPQLSPFAQQTPKPLPQQQPTPPQQQAPPFSKGRLGGIFEAQPDQIHPNPPLQKEETISPKSQQQQPYPIQQQAQPRFTGSLTSENLEVKLPKPPNIQPLSAPPQTQPPIQQAPAQPSHSAFIKDYYSQLAQPLQQQQTPPTSSSPQMRGGVPQGRRGVEVSPVTPPPTPSSTEEGRMNAPPQPSYTQGYGGQAAPKTQQPQPTQQPPPPSRNATEGKQPPPQPQLTQPTRKDSYLEPTDGAPEKPTPQKPPDDRIQGNIIDLKNLEK